jgi:hypothetical protein
MLREQLHDMSRISKANYNFLIPTLTDSSTSTYRNGRRVAILRSCLEGNRSHFDTYTTWYHHKYYDADCMLLAAFQ